MKKITKLSELIKIYTINQMKDLHPKAMRLVAQNLAGENFCEDFFNSIWDWENTSVKEAITEFAKRMMNITFSNGTIWGIKKLWRTDGFLLEDTMNSDLVQGVRFSMHIGDTVYTTMIDLTHLECSMFDLLTTPSTHIGEIHLSDGRCVKFYFNIKDKNPYSASLSYKMFTKEGELIDESDNPIVEDFYIECVFRDVLITNI